MVVAELDPDELSLMFIVVSIPNIFISLLLESSLAGDCPCLHVSFVINSLLPRIDIEIDKYLAQNFIVINI